MHDERRFPVWVQFACVAGYFGTDLFLRFSYQAVLGADVNANTNTQGEYSHDDDSIQDYVTENYSKPAFMALCGYVLFFFWGPLLVWPYLKFVTKVSVVTYYQTTWSGDLEFRQAFRYTCLMGCILFFGNLGYVAGLRYINVALASALSQGEAPFTVALSVLFLHRVFGTNEQIGIGLSFTGIVLIAVPPVLRAAASSSDALDQIGGILSTLIGAFGFGCYQVFWPMFDARRYSATNPAPTNPVDAIIDTFATLSLVGAFLLSTGWVVLILFHLLGWETLEVPPESIRGALLCSTILTAIVDALNGIACVIASAMVVALSYPLIIPLSVMMQVFIDGIPIGEWGIWGWIGTALVVAGVFCLETNNNNNDNNGPDNGEIDAENRHDVDCDQKSTAGSYIEMEERVVGVYA